MLVGGGDSGGGALGEFRFLFYPGLLHLLSNGSLGAGRA